MTDDTTLEVKRERAAHAANYITLALDCLGKLQPFGGMNAGQRVVVNQMHHQLIELRAQLINGE
jgi:hypothetical protein